MNARNLETFSEPAVVNEICERARAACAVMKSIRPEWNWEERSAEEFEADLAAIEDGGLKIARTEGEVVENHASGVLNVALEALHAFTVKTVSLLRIAWTSDPVRGPVLRNLSAAGKTADAILAEAEELEAAWEEVEPGCAPLAGLDLAALRAGIAAVRDGRQALRRARVQRRLADGRLAVAVAALNDWLCRWYAVATAVFAAGTDNGDVIRAEVPTTYVPRYYRASKERRQKARAATKPQPAGGDGTDRTEATDRTKPAPAAG